MTLHTNAPNGMGGIRGYAGQRVNPLALLGRGMAAAAPPLQLTPPAAPVQEAPAVPVQEAPAVPVQEAPSLPVMPSAVSSSPANLADRLMPAWRYF